MDFPDLGRPGLVHRKLRPAAPHLQGRASYFEEIARQDILLHYPYHAFSSWWTCCRRQRLIEVVSVNLYRVAKGPHGAALNGKGVQVVIGSRAVRRAQQHQGHAGPAGGGIQASSGWPASRRIPSSCSSRVRKAASSGLCARGNRQLQRGHGGCVQRPPC